MFLYEALSWQICYEAASVICLAQNTRALSDRASTLTRDIRDYAHETVAP